MSKQSSTQTSPYAGALAQMGEQAFWEANPTYKNYLNMLNQILQTGGTGVGIPLIQQSTAAARQGLSQSTAAANQQLAAMGLASDPTSRNVTNMMNTQGEQQIAEIGPNLSMQLLTGLSGMPSQGMGTGTSALSGAVGATPSTTSTGLNLGGLFTSLLGSSNQSASGASGLGALLQELGFGGTP